ncbi:transcription factor MYB17-like [Hibiscus syriacus]|uniref:transcription factor MYB17-like n=1 Tax=Hibiscus syriacus TaxID=106335 RepID=UPI001920C3D7|nr:transcription factor MYB17-like [Hibiscus syriacus]
MAAPIGLANGDPKWVSNLTHMAQWESARLEAEARLVKESSKQLNCRQAYNGVIAPLNLHCLDILKAWQNLQLEETVIDNDDNDDNDDNSRNPWNMRTCSSVDDDDLKLIKGFSKEFSGCESEGRNDENSDYWDDIFNLVDCDN